MVFDIAHVSGAWGLAIVLIVLWTIPWKGYALWLAAKNDHPKWFIALLIVNTFAILEIIYIFAVARKGVKKPKEDSGAQTTGGKAAEYTKHETVRVYSESEK
jgi:hypothetical protein